MRLENNSDNMKDPLEILCTSLTFNNFRILRRVYIAYFVYIFIVVEKPFIIGFMYLSIAQVFAVAFNTKGSYGV